jgi:hypothetical protein
MFSVYISEFLAFPREPVSFGSLKVTYLLIYSRENLQLKDLIIIKANFRYWGIVV